MLLCAMQIDLAGKDVALKRWDNFMQKSDLYGIPGRRHAIRFMPFTWRYRFRLEWDECRHLSVFLLSIYQGNQYVA